ncbi:MAG: DUF1730 domain-containing protein [Clostridiales bacterium]|jgi:epoxyqueuosine reductase|nr:DUF1730 domain-containing protein [Clostridiales bacterium]
MAEYAIGVSGARRLDYLEGYDFSAPFVKPDPEPKINPSVVLSGARSVIAVAVPYARARGINPDGKNRLYISSIALIPDYHRAVRRILEEIDSALPPHRSKALIDSGKLNERAFAVRCGVAFRARNRSVVSAGVGGFTALGLLVTDLPPEDTGIAPLPPGDASLAACGDCRACVAACPGGALREDGYDYTRCASYITQKPGDLTETEARLTGGWLYGCDACRDVCPFNAGVPALEYVMPLPAEIAGMTDGEWDARFGGTAARWRGADIMRRNALLNFA